MTTKHRKTKLHVQKAGISMLRRGGILFAAALIILLLAFMERQRWLLLLSDDGVTSTQLSMFLLILVQLFEGYTWIDLADQRLLVPVMDGRWVVMVRQVLFRIMMVFHGRSFLHQYQLPYTTL